MTGFPRSGSASQRPRYEMDYNHDTNTYQYRIKPENQNKDYWQVEHPVNFKMHIDKTVARSMGEFEQKLYGQDSVHNKGLVPVYHSPNVDSLGSFPYKNALTPSSLISCESLELMSAVPRGLDDMTASRSLSSMSTTMEEYGRLHDLEINVSKRKQPMINMDVPDADEDRTRFKRSISGTPSVVHLGTGFRTPSNEVHSRQATVIHKPMTSIDVERDGIYSMSTIMYDECPRHIAQMILAVCILCPPLWLLLGTGLFDQVTGVIPLRIKQAALILSGISFTMVIACMIVGLTVGTR